MVEAVQTAASPAEIWTICVVAVAALAFWLAAVMVAGVREDRSSHRTRPSKVPGPFRVNVPRARPAADEHAARPRAAASGRAGPAPAGSAERGATRQDREG